MYLKLSIIADNVVADPGFLAEHGFAVFVETDAGKFLFDTGQGMVLHANARMMGINLCDIEDIVLSHGHYDHANGVRMLYCNSKLRIYAHPMVFKPRFKKISSKKYKNIGIDWLDNAMIVDKVEWMLSEEPRFLADNIVLSGTIPRVTDFEQST